MGIIKRVSNPFLRYASLTWFKEKAPGLVCASARKDPIGSKIREVFHLSEADRLKKAANRNRF